MSKAICTFLKPLGVGGTKQGLWQGCPCLAGFCQSSLRFPAARGAPGPRAAARGHQRTAAEPAGCAGAPAALDGNVALQQPGMAAWGEPGSGYPCAPRASPRILRAPLHPAPTRSAPAIAWAKPGRECCLGGCHCPVPPTMLLFPNEVLSVSGNKSSRALQCCPQPELLWRGAASPAHPEPAIAGTHGIRGRQPGSNPHGQAALHLCPRCHQDTDLQLCRQGWGTPAWHCQALPPPAAFCRFSAQKGLTFPFLSPE